MALGWQGWQAVLDDYPDTGGGPSMFAQFADVLEASDFQSIVTKQPEGNVEDLRTLFTEDSLADLTADGLFAWNSNRERSLIEAGRPTYDFVKEVVRSTGREAR